MDPPDARARTSELNYFLYRYNGPNSILKMIWERNRI
jgi:hypothetical protein